MTKIKTREEWLNVVLHKHVAKLLKDKAGVTLPADCKVSVGFPGGGSARKRIGECWPRSRSSVGVNEIFLNPAVKSVTLLVEVLVHEAIHAADDCQSGHKGFFRRTALGVGLEGKMTSTVAGPVLREWIESKIEALGAMPYGSLDLSGRKKQTTRMIKLECVNCGCIIRTTDKWVSTMRDARCGCDGQFDLA